MKNGLPLGLGVALVLFGLLWTAQGLGYVQGSFMTGQKLWTAIGLLCVCGGAALLITRLKKR